jgi:protein-disulfide isomerase
MMYHEHAIGRPDAPLELMEYGDYACPHCARAYLMLQVIRAELGDAIRFTFRNFPLPEVNPQAMAAAEAAESVAAHAGESAYWDMHAMMCENQDALEIDDLLGYAVAAGADASDVAADLSSGAMRERVRHDIRRGMEAGVSATPAFFVNGRRFDGDWSDADAFTAALHAATRETALP